MLLLRFCPHMQKVEHYLCMTIPAGPDDERSLLQQVTANSYQ